MKKYRFFIIKFPNGRETLYRAKNTGWHDLTNITEYLNKVYCDNIFIRSISLWQMIKYIFRGNKDADK